MPKRIIIKDADDWCWIELHHHDNRTGEKLVTPLFAGHPSSVASPDAQRMYVALGFEVEYEEA
jgi:hypothetical protein